jgi:outer membrane protein W
MFAEKSTTVKKTILAAIAVFSALAATAQSKGNIEFGIGAGVNFSNLSVRGSNNYWGNADGSTAFNVGASLDYYFSDRWSIKVKPAYDRKGWDNDVISDGVDSYSTDINTDYITVPVMANWHFGRKRNWYLNFGPYVGFLISAKETRFDTDLKNAFETTDIGAALGIGVKIPLNEKLKLFIDYQEQTGFSPVFKNDDSINAFTVRTSFNVGLNFLLK